jgi:hypothetical protein
MNEAVTDILGRALIDARRFTSFPFFAPANVVNRLAGHPARLIERMVQA